MDLKSYFNPTTKVVQIRLAADAAPSAPFVALGALTHTEGTDNVSGAQKHTVSHAIYSHVQEQLFLQKSIQDMQRISITYGGGFKPILRMLVNQEANRLGIGMTSTLKVSFDPVDATHDPVVFSVSNPALITEVANTGNGTYVFKNKSKGELFVKVKSGTFEQNFPYEFTEDLAAFVPVASIALAPATVALTVAAPTAQLVPTVLPANATNKDVTYVSSDPTKATVSATGLVTRVANGTATITATAKDGSGITGTKLVTVTA